MSTTETAPPVVEATDRFSTLRPVADDPPGVVTRPAASAGTRVVLRRIDPWSALKLSLVFYLCVCLVLLVAGVVLWIGASASGMVDNVEGFFQDAGFEGFSFSPGMMLRASAIGGITLVAAGTLANMLLAGLFNLMSDLVGGLRVTLTDDPHERRRR